MSFLSKRPFGKQNIYSAGHNACDTIGMAYPELKLMLEQKGISTVYMGSGKKTQKNIPSFSSLAELYNQSNKTSTKQKMNSSLQARTIKRSFNSNS